MSPEAAPEDEVAAWWGSQWLAGKNGWPEQRLQLEND